MLLYQLLLIVTIHFLFTGIATAGSYPFSSIPGFGYPPQGYAVQTGTGYAGEPYLHLLRLWIEITSFIRSLLNLCYIKLKLLALK